jgi:hypothetical protein
MKINKIIQSSNESLNGAKAKIKGFEEIWQNDRDSLIWDQSSAGLARSQKFFQSVQESKTKIKNYTTLIKTFEKNIGLCEKMLNDFVSIMNVISKGLNLIDDILINTSHMKNSIFNSKMSELKIADGSESKYNMKDIKSLRNEVLTLEELNQRSKFLTDNYDYKNEQDKIERDSINELFSKVNSKNFEGKTVEVSRLKQGVAYYYVTIPVSQDLSNIISKLHSFKKSLKDTDTLLYDQGVKIFEILSDYSYNTQGTQKEVETQISYLEKLNDLVNKMRQIKGCGKQQTKSLFDLGKEYMNFLNLKGVLLVLHKDRVMLSSLSQEGLDNIEDWIHFEKTDTYTVILGIKDAFVRISDKKLIGI